ncbi:MAG: ABC transporter permease [Eggerthellaceae bacterium]|nr:ABC transporter permease [Eggerthellaceae bacterium]
MRNVLAIARRILVQFAHDKRTLGLLFVAPIVVLWLLTVLLGQGEYEPRLAAVDLPSEFEACLVDKDATVTVADMDEAERMLRANEVDAVLYCAGEEGDELVVWAEGSDSTKTSASLRVATEALADMRADAADRMKADVESKRAELEDLKQQAEQKRQEVLDRADELRATFDDVPDALKQQLGVSEEDLDIASEFDDIEYPNLDDFGFDLSDYLPVSSVEVSYLHGNDEWKMFDFYGPVFIGIFLFVFVFITSGMSLVNERSAGTMKRFLATPVRPAEVLGGYTLGFGALALVQSAIIVLIALTLIGFPCEGNVALVVLTAVSLAIVSVTLGLLVSGLASSAFQVIQLMLLFVVPQILLSGLFDLSAAPGWLQAISSCLPLTYGVDALRAIMLRGAGLAQIGLDLAVVWGFAIAFFVLASIGFRKKRATR